MRDYTEFKYHHHFFESEKLLSNLIIQIFPEFSWRYYKCNDAVFLDNGFLDISNSDLIEINEKEYKSERSHKYQTLNYELQDEIMQSKDFSLTVGTYMEYLFVEFQHYIHHVYKETESRNEAYLFNNIFKAIEESNDYYSRLLDNPCINKLQKRIIKNLIYENQRKPELIVNEFSDLVPYVSNSLISAANHKSVKDQCQYPDIFSSEKSEKWFMSTLETMSISPEKNGFNAKLNAIYSNPDCKVEIFKYELLLKDYIAFINTIFPDSVKNNTKMSEPSRHALKVDQLINLYVQDKPE